VALRQRAQDRHLLPGQLPDQPPPHPQPDRGRLVRVRPPYQAEGHQLGGRVAGGGLARHEQAHHLQEQALPEPVPAHLAPGLQHVLLAVEELRGQRRGAHGGGQLVLRRQADGRLEREHVFKGGHPPILSDVPGECDSVPAYPVRPDERRRRDVPLSPDAHRVRPRSSEDPCFSVPRPRLTSAACSTAPSASPSAGPTPNGCAPSSPTATTATTASGWPSRTARSWPAPSGGASPAPGRSRSTASTPTPRSQTGSRSRPTCSATPTTRSATGPPTTCSCRSAGATTTPSPPPSAGVTRRAAAPG